MGKTQGDLARGVSNCEFTHASSNSRQRQDCKYGSFLGCLFMVLPTVVAQCLVVSVGGGNCNVCLLDCHHGTAKCVFLFNL